MGGREGANTLNRERSGNRMFCFEDVSDGERLIQQAHVAASAGPCMALGACVGQTASSKGLASEFIMVVIAHLRMVAGSRPSKDIDNSAMKR